MKNSDIVNAKPLKKKKISLIIKIVFLILVVILILVPLYQFVQGFEPEHKIIEFGHPSK